MHSNLLAVIFALLSAMTIAWGAVVRHRIAGEAKDDGTIKGSPLGNAVSRPLWWAGTATALLGYALQIVALSFGTLLVVQPILVLSLVFTLLLSSRMESRSLDRGEIYWSLALSGAVAVLLLVGRPSAGHQEPSGRAWTWSLVAGAAALVVLGIAAGRRPGRRKALLTGLATGATFGYVAVLSKAFVDIIGAEGLPGIVASWESYALVLGAILGTAIQQFSFQAGPLSQSLPAMTIGEPLVAFSLGYLVLGESFQVGFAVEWIILAVALVVMVASTWKLSQK